MWHVWCRRECVQVFGRETCRKESTWRGIELKWILNKYDWRAWTGVILLRKDASEGIW
jgi:hypothetical protein